jgi:hypothetical protein
MNVHKTKGNPENIFEIAAPPHFRLCKEVTLIPGSIGDVFK